MELEEVFKEVGQYLGQAFGELDSRFAKLAEVVHRHAYYLYLLKKGVKESTAAWMADNIPNELLPDFDMMMEKLGE